MDDSLDKVPFKQLKQLVERLETQPHLADRLDEVEISFEFIVGSLFPSVLTNIQNALKDEHTKGFIEGSKITPQPMYEVSCDECGEIWFDSTPSPMYCPQCGAELWKLNS